MYLQFLLLFGFLFHFSKALSDDSLAALFSSSPEQVVTLSSYNDFLIDDVVNSLSGQPSLRQTDLVAQGAQSISLNRIFIPNFAPLKNNGKGNLSKESYAGWVHFPHVRLNLCTLSKQNKAQEMHVCVVDSNGVSLVFALENGQTILESDPWGICNGITDAPSGKYDARNTRIYVDKNQVIVQIPDGSERFYKPSCVEAVVCGKKRYECSLYLLQKEILPNGKILKYYYENGNLKRVESLDPQERYVYAFLDLSISPFKKNGLATTHSGLTAAYAHETSKFYEDKDISQNLNLLFPFNITKARTPFFQNETLGYQKKSFYYGTKEAHTSLLLYNGQQHYFQCDFAEFLERQRDMRRLFKESKHEKLSSDLRVQTLQLPGAEDSLEPVFTFNYEFSIPGFIPGRATVTHWDGAKTIFSVNSKMLPILIEYHDKEGVRKKEKIFNWYDNHWLKSIEIKDENRRTLSKKTFSYDAFGNPEIETFEGDLSGSGQYETYTIKRKFSKDGRNLLLSEEYEEGKAVIYSYRTNSNLIETIVTKDRDLVVSREIRKYDDCNNLISIASKDETGTRTTKYILRKENPFLHMPEWIEESFEEKGNAILLKRRHLHYDQHGNIKKEDIYDADNKYRYSIHKEYNERGDLISETDPLGHKAIYTYDSHGRLATSTGFSGKNTKTTTYDLKGRPRSIQEKGNDDIIRTTFHEYDHNDCVIKKTDPFWHETHYTYDLISQKPIQTISPSLPTPNGVIPVITQATYDVLGRKLQYVDANKNVTRYTYNAYDSPIEIIHADQSRESFVYTKSGRLSCHTDRDGLSIRYVYDGLGRILIKKYEKNGQFIAQETFIYQGMYLHSKTDKQGTLTTYEYDGAGRKVCEEIAGRRTTFSYDALGYLKTVCYECENPLYIHYLNDNLGQVLQKTHADSTGTPLSIINHTYDADGNVQTIRRNINGVESIETFDYDSQKRLKSRKDSLDQVTTTQYNENFKNEHGQRVLQKTVINPKNISTVETYDPYGHVVKKETLDSENDVISAEQHIYDACGNECQHLQHVYEGKNYRNIKTTQFNYDNVHRITSFTRAFDTPFERTTKFTYTPGGKTKQKTQSDGTILSYDYDALGYLKKLSSSDDMIQHVFRYDSLGNLLYASDEVSGITVERKFDPFGNVLSEKYNDICIEKTYDRFDRPLKVTLPDSSAIAYNYDPLFCRSVERYSPSGEVLYAHRYDEFDLDGHLKSETLLGGLGTVSYGTDLKGRSISIHSPFFQQSCTYDAVDNLVHLVTNGSPKAITYDDLNQLTSESSDEINEEYLHDSSFNRLKHNGFAWQHNSLDEIECTDHGKCSFDLNGNLSQKTNSEGSKTYSYDTLNRLTEYQSSDTRINLIYDPIGRKIGKVVSKLTNDEWVATQQEAYLYDGNNDIGTLDQNKLIKQFRILGINKRNVPSTVAIELDGKPFVPIQDSQGNIRGLVDGFTGIVTSKCDFTAFGEPLRQIEGPFNPWQYASKRFDSDLKLIDFGKRYYDPSLGRWLTTDPAGFIDVMNLYAFLRNNPFSYVDPDGRFAFAIPAITLFEIFFGASIVAIEFISIETVAVAATLAVAAVSLNEISQLEDKAQGQATEVKEPAGRKKGKKETDRTKKPPYSGDVLGEDPTKCPGEGFEWKGNGSLESGEGSWFNETTYESLYPDLNHPPPMKPHWDYKGPKGKARLFTDGTWEYK